MYDIQQIRADFPILGRTVYGKPLVYLDNGATTHALRGRGHHGRVLQH